MDDHSINDMDEMMEAPVDPEDWDDEDDEWDDEDDEWDDEDNKDDDQSCSTNPPEVIDHNIPLKPFTPDGDLLEVNDEVLVVGDIAKTEKEVYVSDQMRQMINNGKKYRVDAIHKGDNYLVGCGGWNFCIENIKKINPNKKEKKKQIFHYNLQHIDLE